MLASEVAASGLAGRDQHQLVRRGKHPGQAGRRRVDHGQRVPFGQQVGETPEVIAFEGVRSAVALAVARQVGDHVEPGGRAGWLARLARLAWLARLTAGQERLRRDGWRAACG